MLGFRFFFWIVNLYAINYEKTEVNNFIAVSPQPNVYDFSFLAPCPTSGQVVYSENDELVTKESISNLIIELKIKKGIEVLFSKIKNSNHFFKK